jgi:hypothetical protein
LGVWPPEGDPREKGLLKGIQGSVAGVTKRMSPDRRGSGSGRQRDQALADVPSTIGPVVFGTLGVGWVMVRRHASVRLLVSRPARTIGAEGSAIAAFHR